MFIVSHATVCFCMLLVGYPQTSEPLIPLADWHKLTYLVLTCRKIPINQHCKFVSTVNVRLLFIRLTSNNIFYFHLPANGCGTTSYGGPRFSEEKTSTDGRG